MKDLVFVIGVGRSGTTLLQSMLHAHPDIHFTRETHFVKRYISKEVSGKSHNRKNWKKLQDKLLADERLADFRERVQKSMANCLADKKEPYLTACIFRKLLEDGGDSKYLGDKDPMNVNFLPTIKSAFSGARIIHIIRDPRDVVLSRIKSKWGKRTSLLWHCSEYKYSIQKAQFEGPILFGSSYIEVRYEDLLVKTEEVLRQLCTFLGIEFSDKMLNHKSEASSLLRKDEMDWKSDVLGDVNKSKIGRWKSGLSRKQVLVIESLLQKQMQRLNYTAKGGGSIAISPFLKPASWAIVRMFKYRFG